jgi:hypothetical protein
VSRASGKIPLGVLACGALLLVSGAVAGRRFLPEWGEAPPLDPALVGKATRLVAAAGGKLEKPRIGYGGGGSRSLAYERAYRLLGTRATEDLMRTGAVRRVVRGSVRIPQVGLGGAALDFDREGRLRSFDWSPSDVLPGLTEISEGSRREREAFIGKVLDELRGGDAPSGPETSYLDNSSPVRVQPLAPVAGAPPESLVRMEPPGGTMMLYRSLSDPEAHPSSTALRTLLYTGAPQAVLTLLVLVLFALLLFRRRISPRLGLILGGLAFLSMLVGGLGPEGDAGAFVWGLFAVTRVLLVVYLPILWMVGESLLRDTVPGFTTSLDALAAGRLGPRAGRALLAGLGMGAGVAGLRFLVQSLLAALATGVFPSGPTYDLPLFSGRATPFYEGPYTAAVFALFIALLRFVLPRRLAEVLAAFVLALVLSLTVPVDPWLGALAAALPVAALLLWVFWSFGFASLLAACVSASLFRETLAALHLGQENALVFLLGFVLLAVIASAGVIGARRPAREDEGKVEAPEYVRRLETERRVKYEMDLLSRMQLALLPEKPPEVEGLDIAVKTVLATEAGGDLYDFAVDESGALWIAAGDVSGHGYSCGIQQAMVKASLASLVKAGRKPGEVLCEVDRVLRTGHTRLFTSLCLLRLEPASGTGLFANAGHPFPLLLVGGECRELAAPGLPLAQGPARKYEDHVLEIPTGGVLVLASDGLYEGPDRFDEPYGYDRPVAVLTSVGLHRRPADAIVEALDADWRRHVGEGAPADDTTILVLKRPNLYA